MDFCALGLELLNPALHVGKLALELVDLVCVRADGLVEGRGEQVGHGLGLDRVHGRHWRTAHGHATTVAAVAHSACRWRVVLLLRLLLAGIHVGVVVVQEYGLVLAAALGALLGELVETL